MKMYYYMLTMNNEQIFTEVDSENFSETKVKNAIAKKAVELRNDISEENKKAWIKAFKQNIYMTFTLLEEKTNIEVKGNFKKTDIEIVDVKIRNNKGSFDIEKGYVIKSKILNDVYAVKLTDTKRYKIIYRGIILFNSKTREVNNIDEMIKNIPDLETTIDKILGTEKEAKNNNTKEVKEKKYIVKNTKNNKNYKPEMIEKIFNGVASGEYIGLKIENNIIWFLSSEVIEVSPTAVVKIDKIIEQNFIKINLLNKKIDRLLNKAYLLKKVIEKKNIKYNNRDDNLIQELIKLNNIMDSIDNRIDAIGLNINNLRKLQYNINTNILKAEYGSNKYKIIDNYTNKVIYSNTLDNYINNYNYTIRVLINNTEYFKQYIFKGNPSYLIDSLKIVYYKNNDTHEKIIKEIYTNSNNNILYLLETIKKSNIELLYMKNNIINKDYISINNTNVNNCKEDIYNKALEMFKNYEVIYTALLDNRNTTFNKQTKNKDKKEIFLNMYIDIIDKFSDLKKIAENIEYFNNIYKDNLKDFYKKYNTNARNWSNYLCNYKTLQKILKLEDCKNYEFKVPYEVVYTKKYRKL